MLNDLLKHTGDTEGPEREYVELAGNISLQLYDHQICFCWNIHSARGTQNRQLEPKDSEVQSAVGAY